MREKEAQLWFRPKTSVVDYYYLVVQIVTRWKEGQRETVLSYCSSAAKSSLDPMQGSCPSREDTELSRNNQPDLKTKVREKKE